MAAVDQMVLGENDQFKGRRIDYAPLCNNAPLCKIMQYADNALLCNTRICTVVQYADDIIVFTSSKKIESAVESLELNVNNICDFFENID